MSQDVDFVTQSLKSDLTSGQVVCTDHSDTSDLDNDFDELSQNF